MFEQLKAAAIDFGRLLLSQIGDVGSEHSPIVRQFETDRYWSAFSRLKAAAVVAQNHEQFAGVQDLLDALLKSIQVQGGDDGKINVQFSPQAAANFTAALEALPK